MDQNVIKCCGLLELVGAINKATVKAAYRRQMMMWHPDRHQGDPVAHAQAECQAKLINNAYECLTEALEQGPVGSVGAPVSKTTAGAGGWDRPRHVYHRKPFKPGFPDRAVFEVFIKSSNIVSAGYSPPSQTMYIKFQDGAIYRYFDVPTSVFESFLSARSHGGFAHKKLYSVYRHERCQDAETRTIRELRRRVRQYMK